MIRHFEDIRLQNDSIVKIFIILKIKTDFISKREEQKKPMRIMHKGLDEAMKGVVGTLYLHFYPFFSIRISNAITNK